MAVPFSNTKLRVPRGFQNLLEGFAREVLRSQPSELYTFGAEYFENLQKQRDESGIDPAEHGAKVEDRFYNNKAFTEPSVDPSNPQQQDAALAIQTKYRQHAAKQEVENIREDKAATKIQAGFRGHQDREKVKQIRSGSGEAAGDGEVDTAVPIEEEIDIDLADPEVEAAAVKIQAGFKGFKARQEVQRIKVTSAPSAQTAEPTIVADQPTESSAPAEDEIDINLNDPDVEKAAVKIQASYKGFRTRKDLADNKPKLQVLEESAPSPIYAVTYAKEVASQSCAPEAEEQIDIDLEDPEVEQAALTIQAGFKSFKARKENLENKDEKAPTSNQLEEEIDIDLTDPEVEKAAQKIQARFKGFKGKKECANPSKSGEASKSTVQVNETSTEPEPINPDEEVDIDLNDPEVEQAAIKIQAGFKGLKARRDFSAKQKAADEAETEESGEAVTTADENAAGVVPAAEPEKASETTTEPEKPASDQTEVLTAETAETLTEASANPAAPAEPNVPAEAAVTDSAVTDAAATDATDAVATEPAAAESAVAESAAAETAVSEPTAVEPSAAMPAATEPAAAEPAASELAADEVVAEAASEQLVPAAVSNTTDTAAEPEAPVAEAVDANKPVEAATADGGSGEVPAEQVAEPAQPAES